MYIRQVSPSLCSPRLFIFVFCVIFSIQYFLRYFKFQRKWWALFGSRARNQGGTYYELQQSGLILKNDIHVNVKPTTQCLIIKHNIVHMRTVFPCEKVRGRSGGVLTWYHGLGGGRLFGEGVFQSMGCLLEKIWYLPHTCTVVAFASGVFLFWKILTCSIPKDTYKKVIERDYLWIWVHLYETIFLLGQNCGQKLQMPVWSFGKLSLKSQRSVSSCNACGRKGEKQMVLL